jgi:hypothetical protein
MKTYCVDQVLAGVLECAAGAQRLKSHDGQPAITLNTWHDNQVKDSRPAKSETHTDFGHADQREQFTSGSFSNPKVVCLILAAALLL